MDNSTFGQPEMQDISRQRAFAKLLQDQSLQQDPGQMVSGHYVAPSWTQQLAKVLQGGLASYNNNQADTQEKAYATTKNQGLADLLAANKPQQIAGEPTVTTAMPAYTPDQQDQFGSPLPDVQREPVTTSTPNMVTETPAQQMARVQPLALQYMAKYGNTPESQYVLAQLGKSDDRAYDATKQAADWAHQDLNVDKAHTYDASIYDKGLADKRLDTQTGYAHDATVKDASNAFTTSERLNTQKFTAGQAASNHAFQIQLMQDTVDMQGVLHSERSLCAGRTFGA